MLRTLKSPQPELVRLCHDKAWASVALRAKSYPEEARPSPLALQGHGTTALAIAVRSGASTDVLQVIVQANIHQIGIHHERRGTVIHEALRHRSEHEVLKYLLKSLIHYENVHNRATSHTKPNLLGKHDDLGRTALHYLVEHSVRDMTESSRLSFNWVLFRSLVLAYPEAVGTMDSDGNTPLTLLLLTPRLERDEHNAQLSRMVKLLLIACPASATISKRLNQPWRHPRNGVCQSDGCVTVGDGAPNPLACALLYGRKLNTIQLLLEANQKVGVKACLAIISQYHEVPLHVAVSLRASPSILSMLLEHGREAVGVCDVHGLVPLVWVWIRFVVDWFSTEHPLATVMASKRRFVPTSFSQWHGRLTQKLSDPISLDPLGTFLRDQLWERIAILLPATAAIQQKSCNEQDSIKEWDALHAACYVNCPLALVRLALQCSPSHVSKRDTGGRLPLHYAASRLGFTAKVPVGVRHRLATVSEGSLPIGLLLHHFPKAAHVVDDNYQLPLHIAIERAKQQRAKETSVAIQTLLHHYPDALERRDGETMLYPFLQAAAGDVAGTSIIYALLREHPTLVAMGIPHC